jgi:hypothetical protein
LPKDDKEPEVESGSAASTFAWQTVNDAQVTTTARNRVVTLANGLCDDFVHRISARLTCGRIVRIPGTNPQAKSRRKSRHFGTPLASPAI